VVTVPHFGVLGCPLHSIHDDNTTAPSSKHHDRPISNNNTKLEVIG
jgi:hypothetical protein